MWDVYGGIGYKLKSWLSAIAGFRATGVDFRKGGFVFDVTLYGPLIGAVLRF